MRSVLTLLLAVALASAQSRPEFEVASLKPGLPVGDKFNINLGTLSHGTLTLTNASLADCLHYAYSLSNNDQLAGPSWITDKTVRFDIVAKAPSGATNAEIRVMLQTLLNNRFQIAMRREQRILKYMALTAGKDSSAIHKANEDADTSHNSNTIGRIVSARMPMLTLATVLSRFLGEPVVDLTGLPGLYEVHLEWSPDPALSGAANAVADSEFPSIRKAIEEQLGLRLEPRKGPLEVLVIDRALREPLAN
jgi:uncharacterized protein (TIGR03435 family)